MEKEKFASYEIIDFRLKKRYLKYFNEEKLINYQSDIIEFKVTIDSNLNFYDTVLKHLKVYIQKLVYANLDQHKKDFFLFLLKLFPDHKDLKKKGQHIFLFRELDYYKNLRRKIKMIKLELSCFNEIYNDYLSLLDKLNKEEIKNESLEHKIEEVENLKTEYVGFFKKVKKEDKLSDLKEKLYKSDLTLKFLKKLFEASGKIIFLEFIPFIKKHKKQRFFETIDLFARSNINLLKANKGFWEKFIESQKDDFFNKEKKN